MHDIVDTLLDDANPFVMPEDAVRPLTVCIVGLGYIGLPTAAVLASRGSTVYGCDIRQEVVDTINQGRIHIHEPGLDRIVKAVVQRKKLVAACQPKPADVFILSVPTPVTADQKPDVSYVEQASRSIRPFVRPGNLIILESTSPPETTNGIVVRHAVPEGMVVGRDVFVAHCPERVLPGRILVEVIENDRIVGGVTPTCTERARRFYASFVTGDVLPTTSTGAEITKLAENAFRDVNIAFANELATLCENLGVDPLEVIELANRHPRVNILNPGPGVGGHCISVDPWFLVHAAPGVTPLIRTAREVNDRQPHRVVEKVEALAAGRRNPVIGCLGLAYKADIDDLRESPSVEVARLLHQRGLGHVVCCDPYVTAERFTELPLLSLDDILEWSEILVLLTDHRAFRDIPASRLKNKLVLDTRGIWRGN
jgi:UDP-N-acetyl-D-mannosaminuronic acid dehydrogenase